MSYKVAIVGAGPAGCMVASNLNKNFEITKVCIIFANEN